MMGFSQPSEVRSVLVSVGDRVEKGDVLVRARDGDIQAAYRLQQRRAENRFEILAAQNRVDLAQIEFDNQQTAQDQGGGSTLEYERARASLENAKIELDTANERFIEQGIILERQEADLERFAITAQFDGMVAAIEVTPGQAMQDSEPVLRLVSIDPLQVKVPTPTSTVLAEQLERGDKAWVAVSVAGEPKMFEGTITEVSPVADFGSDKVWVKVEMPNPDRLLSGLPAWVRFSEPTEGFMRILAEHEADDDTRAAADDGEQLGEPALAADAGATVTDISNLRTPAWRRVVEELSAESPNATTFLARLCGVLTRVANARQGSVVIVSASDTQDQSPDEPSIAYA
ncbi:Cobalt-zinc-cadmium resistance protein CzcB (Cation efflux system protein CzcB), partial [Durusdinium trenchii]